MAKYYFRFHRGDLIESMKTMKEFKSIDDMKKYIISEYAEMSLPETLTLNSVIISEDVVFEHLHDWLHTHLVTLKLPSGVSFCIGFLHISDKNDIINE